MTQSPSSAGTPGKRPGSRPRRPLAARACGPVRAAGCRPRRGLADLVLALRLPALAAAYLGFSTVQAAGWRDLGFVQMGVLLLHGGAGGGLHSYATAGYLQMGPLTFAVAALLALLAPYHLPGAVWALGLGLLLATVRSGESAALAAAPPGGSRAVRTATLLAGPALAAGWVDMVQGWGHLDDALALTLLAACWAQARRDHAGAAGLLLGLAAAAQPVALLAAPLLLVAAAGRQRAALAAGAVVAAAFLPFQLADPATLASLAGLRIGVQPGSLLHLVYPLHRLAPHWERPAQLGGAWAAGWWCLRRGRPEAVVLAAALVRLALDAGDWGYYTAQLMTGALLLEQYRAPASRAWGAVGLRVWLPWLVLDFDPFLAGGHQDLARLAVLAGLAASLPGIPRLRWAHPRGRPARVPA